MEIVVSDAKFTKGEWIAKAGVSYGMAFGLVYINGGGFDVSGAPDPEAHANLIASAPDMYEMLIKISEAVNSGLYEIELADAITEFGGDIENLLAKARGEK